MRNLKRVLSLALASVMLLGMMVIGASATDFADDAEIVNTEAVEITAGLGLFAGSDGKFNPTGNVTRAQMATIIVKMLYGSDINADQYKGAGTFSDTVAFEGGWAEGYVNLCANLGIVKGYGDGSFKPGNQVTTAEAATMIINALGVDAGAGTWPLTVMSKAEEMKLFSELSPKPGTNVALTRDQLASVAWQGLKYSPAGTTGYVLTTTTGRQVTYNNYADAVTTAVSMYGAATADDHISEVVGEDTLAVKTFDIKSDTGMITANQATDRDADYTTIGGSNYNIVTGLDKIGHKVTIYYKDAYKSEKEPGEAYAIVDECDVYTVSKAIAKAADYKAVFGTANLTVDPDAKVATNLSAAVKTFDSTYQATPDITTVAGLAGIYDYANRTVAIGTYVAHEGKLIAYMAPAAVVATKVSSIVTTAGKESITLPGFGTLQNNEDKDEVNEYEGVAKDDIVLAVKAGTTVTLTKTTTVEGKITRSFTSDGKQYVTVNGANYGRFSQFTGCSVNGALTDAIPGSFDNTYRFYVTADGQFVHYETIEGQADLNNIVYVNYAYVNANTDDGYGNNIAKVYAQVVDMEGKVDSYLLASYKWDATAKAYVASESGTGYSSALGANALGLVFTYPNVTGLVKGFYTFDKASNSTLSNMGIMVPKAVASAYDSNTAPIYAQATTAATTIDSKTSALATGDNNAYLTGTTKFLVFDSTKTGASATATVVTGRLAETIPAGSNVLLSRTGTNRILEVVILDKDPDAVSAADYIYVAKDSYSGQVGASSYTYGVYNNKGERVAVTTDAAEGTVPAGFYTYSVDSEGKYTNLTAVAAARVAYGEQFKTVYNGKVETTTLSDFDISAAALVDARSDDDISDSDVAGFRVTTFDELVGLMGDENAQPVVLLDVYYGIATDKKAEVVVIKGIYSMTLNQAAISFTGTSDTPKTLNVQYDVAPGTALAGMTATWTVDGAAVALSAATGNTVTVIPAATGNATIKVTLMKGADVFATTTCTVTVG